MTTTHVNHRTSHTWTRMKQFIWHATTGLFCFFATKPNLQCVTESRQGTGCDGSEERVYLWWSHILRGYVFVVMHTRMLFHAWLQTGRGVMDYGQIYQPSCFTRIITIILLFSPTVSSFKEGAIEPLPVNRWETFRIKETGCHLSTLTSKSFVIKNRWKGCPEFFVSTINNL